MSTCPSCQAWEANPDSGLYHADCPDCQARALAQSPGYWASCAAMKFRADYSQALRAVAGDDANARDALHRRVKGWAQRIEQRRAELRA